MSKTQSELPRYERKWRDVVHALKIKGIKFEHANIGATITSEDDGFAPFVVDTAYMDKHSPHVGGYYVVYEGGYTSFSPAEAFEDGYARI